MLKGATSREPSVEQPMIQQRDATPTQTSVGSTWSSLFSSSRGKIAATAILTAAAAVAVYQYRK